MRSIKIVAAFVATASAKAKVTNDYNILSIDGGGAKGIIPATVIEKMEKFAFEYATEKKYDVTALIHKDKQGNLRKGQIHMTDLFDMLAGTSAGSLISSMLSIPIDEKTNMAPEFYGSQFYDIMLKDGKNIFAMKSISFGTTFVEAVIGALMLAGLGYLYGTYLYANQKKIRALNDLEAHFQSQLDRDEQHEQQISMSHKVIEGLSENIVQDMKNNGNVNPAVFDKIVKSSRTIAQKAKDQKKTSKAQWTEMTNQPNNIQDNLIDAVDQENQEVKEAMDDAEEYLQETIDEIKNTRLNYMRDGIKRWYMCTVFGFVGFLFLCIFPTAITLFYDQSGLERGGLDKMANDYYRQVKLTQAIPDELLIVAYSYNEAQPRFFSKQMARELPGVYDRTIGEAASSSASMPMAWAPKKFENDYGMQEILIDGGVMANDPSMYAYIMKSNDNDKYKKKNIRILSLACGANPPKDDKMEVEADFTKMDQMTDLESFAFGKIAQWTSTSVMKEMIFRDKQYVKGVKKDISYVRVDGPFKGSFISTEEDNLKLLRTSGEGIWEINKEAIKEFLRQTIDDKLGPAK